MVNVVNLYPPAINRAEILRYAGMQSETERVSTVVDSCIEKASDAFVYRVCYTVLDISNRDEGIDIGFGNIASKALARILQGCERVVVFAATVGIGIDRLIARAKTVSQTEALLMQAFGAERIESLCDSFCLFLSKEYEEYNMQLGKRFSPGYADLPLELQKDIFRLLDCQRSIGLTLNESLLMSPSKSVTAFIGIHK